MSPTGGFPCHHLSPLGTKWPLMDAFTGAESISGARGSPYRVVGGQRLEPPNRKERIMDSATMNAMATYLAAKTYNVRRAADEKLGAVISTEMIILIGLLALALVTVLAAYSGKLQDVIKMATNVVGAIGTNNYKVPA